MLEETHVVAGLAVVERLPRCAEAQIPVSKLRDYALSPESEKGADKAIVFARALGIEREDWPFLRDQLLEEVVASPAIRRPPTEYGLEWEVPVLVTGRNGHVCYVKTGWLINRDDPRPRLVTAYVAPRESVPKLRAVREFFGCATEQAIEAHG